MASKTELIGAEAPAKLFDLRRRLAGAQREAAELRASRDKAVKVLEHALDVIAVLHAVILRPEVFDETERDSAVRMAEQLLEGMGRIRREEGRPS